MKLTLKMPTIQFKPAQKKRKDLMGKKDLGVKIYPCPCYYYPIRKSTDNKESFMLIINLKSG